jgi:hypothetical protein
VSTPAVSLDTVGEPALWPDSGSAGPTEIVNIIRQPSPPPILAVVQTLQEGLTAHDHVHPQPHPSDVADPRPGPPQVSDDAFTQSKGPKSLHIVSSWSWLLFLLTYLMNWGPDGISSLLVPLQGHCQGVTRLQYNHFR